MNCEIVELVQYSGEESTIYSIMEEGKNETLLEEFVKQYISVYPSEVKDILSRLYQMGTKTGARDNFFKKFEGKPGQFICALYDLPDSRLRLYCIKIGMDIVILGGGGEKPDGIRAWQESPKLSEEMNRLMEFAERFFKRVKEGEISLDGLELEGNLIFKDNDNE